MFDEKLLIIVGTIYVAIGCGIVIGLWELGKFLFTLIF